MLNVIKDFLHTAKCLFIQQYRKHNGTAVEICEQIVRSCWTGHYFQSAEGPRLDQFWLRDFGWSLQGLLELGYHEEVKENLKWALRHYKAKDEITTTIMRYGTTLNFPTRSSDSVPMLIYCLKTAGAQDLILEYKDFLDDQISRYYDYAFDPETRLVRKVKYLAEPKDVLQRTRTCVSNSFLIMLANLLEGLPELRNPFNGIDLKEPFEKAFWTGEYFRNDLQDDGRFISSDANVWSYWTGAASDPNMLKKSIDSIILERLDVPFPLKYQKSYKLSWVEPLSRIFFPNYQGDSIWTLHTPIFIDLVNRVYPELAKRYLKQYMDLVEEYQTYVEVFEPDGSDLLKGKFGIKSDTGMLWAAAIPGLVKRINS